MKKTILKCDRCGLEAPESYGDDGVHSVDLTNKGLVLSAEFNSSAELCGKCMDEFSEWWLCLL